jgi:hypothetical protein
MANLDGVYAKLARAEKHRKVAARLMRYFIRNKGGAERKHNAETNLIDVYARLPSPPEIISLLAGDCVHNMRSALDHLVYQLVLSNPDRPSTVPNEKTMFPICDTEEGFDAQIKRGRLKGVTDAPAAIIRRLQPYITRNAGRNYRLHPLWVLSQLENIDKHRRLAVIAGVAIGATADFTMADGATEGHTVSALARDGAKIFSFAPPRPGEGEMSVKGSITAMVALDEPSIGLTDTDLGSILKQIDERIRRTILTELAPHIMA